MSGATAREDDHTPRPATWIGALVVVLVLYGVLVGTGDPGELVAGPVAALLAVGAVFAVAAHVPPFRAAPGSFGLVLRRTAGKALVDSVRVLALLVRGLVTGRRATGRLRTVPIDPGGDDPGSAARRALVIAGGSLPPNALVVTIDRGSERMLVHQLIPSPEAPGRGDREWPL